MRLKPLELLFLNGRFVNHDEEFVGSVAVNVETGLIEKVYRGKSGAERIHRELQGRGPIRITKTVSYGNGSLIFPAMGDIHIHAREDETGKQTYKEDYQSASDAARNGGLAFTACMPNTPSPLVTMDQLGWHEDRHSGLPVEFLNYVAIGPDTDPLPVFRHRPYKIFLAKSVGPLFFTSEEQVTRAISKYRGEFVSAHVELQDVLDDSKSGLSHVDRRPRTAVHSALDLWLPLVEEYDLEAKLCHWTTGERSLDKIQGYIDRGVPIELEVSPLMLRYDADMCRERPELWPKLQMNPSLQSARDREELIEATRNGRIAYLATDHAPHTLDEKYKNFDNDLGLSREEYYKHLLRTDLDRCRELSVRNGTSGTPQLDTFGLMCLWLMAEHDFKPTDIARIAAHNPGNFWNLFKGERKYGRVEEGYLGSFTVLNTSGQTEITRDMVRSRAGWSPYEGDVIQGKVESLILQGEVYHY